MYALSSEFLFIGYFVVLFEHSIYLLEKYLLFSTQTVATKPFARHGDFIVIGLYLSTYVDDSLLILSENMFSNPDIR